MYMHDMLYMLYMYMLMRKIEYVWMDISVGIYRQSQLVVKKITLYMIF